MNFITELMHSCGLKTLQNLVNNKSFSIYVFNVVLVVNPINRDESERGTFSGINGCWSRAHSG